MSTGINFLRIAVIGLSAIAIMGPSLHAASVVVTTVDDLISDEGLCSLREAIAAVNTQTSSGVTQGECTAGDGSNDIITIPNGTYYLSHEGSNDDVNLSGDLDILRSMIIAGSGTGSTIIDARPDSQNEATDRVFDINPGAVNNTNGNNSINVYIYDLTIQQGRAPNGQTNGESGQAGGGLLIDTSMTVLTNIALVNNRAGSGASGGSGGGGGGIETVFNPYSPTTLSIVSGTISNNAAGNGDANASGGSGGGLCSNTSTDLYIASTTISQNSIGTGTPEGRAGGICSYNSVEITDSTIDNNTGEGIYSAYGPLTVLRSSVTSNTSDGIVISNARVDNPKLTNVTLAYNGGTGLVASRGISENALFDAKLIYVTVTGNATGGISTDDNHILNTNALVTMVDSIIAGNGVGANADCIIAGSSSITAGGYNLYLTNSSCPLDSSPTDVITDAPLLGSLEFVSEAFLGGVVIPYSNSPAVNAGSCTAANTSGAIINDERTLTRPEISNGICDIGAIEIQDIIFQGSFENSGQCNIKKMSVC